MPSLTVKLYSVIFKFLFNRRLQTLLHQSKNPVKNSYGVVSRTDEPIAAANPLFSDGVATKDIHIDPLTSLSVRIFLPETALSLTNKKVNAFPAEKKVGYGGYLPPAGENARKLPVILQFHGGGFVSGSNDSVANDLFCRRIAKMCDAIVVAVGYRLAPENRFPAAFDDGVKVLNWLGKQANLAECRKLLGKSYSVHHSWEIVDNFGASMVEPWLAAHADPSRCVLLGVSSGANIANYVARKAVEAGKLLDPVRVVAQVLMYPFFIGSVPTHSEIKLANSYIYDKAMAVQAWKLFLPEEDFDLDHPAANPLNVIPGRGTPSKYVPPTLTVVAEHDWMRDRAIFYSEELRKINVDAPVLDYHNAVHEFATLDVLLKTPQAEACAEDIAIWVKKYISLRGHEFSY
ncbi:putative carboxylesterase 16 [Apium graveolens]|uniref:putative carboxylesterase 16 n=1 Tax=Apium graveolens TaxID=4045 RepID=UPI003D7A7A24